MYCIYCGKAISDNSVWCPHCGKKQQDVDRRNQEEDDGQEGYDAKQSMDHSIPRTPKKRKYVILMGIVCLAIVGVCFTFISHQVLVVKERKYGIAQFDVVDIRDLFTTEGFERYCKKNEIDLTVEKEMGEYVAYSHSIFYVNGEKVCLPSAVNIYFAEYKDDAEEEIKAEFGDYSEGLTKHLKEIHHYGVYSLFSLIEFEKPTTILADYDNFPEADLETLKFIREFETAERDVVYTTYRKHSEGYYEDDDEWGYEDGYAGHIAYIHIPYPEFETKKLYKMQNGVLTNHEGDLVKEENFEAGALLCIYTAKGKVDTSTYASRCRIRNYWRDLSCEIEYNNDDDIFAENLKEEINWEWLLYGYYSD